MDQIDALNESQEFHLKIKKFEWKLPDKFKESGIIRCGHCKATGVKDGIDINFICSHCIGIGYDIPTTIGGCPFCNSSGKKLLYQNDITECEICEGEGRLDWVDAIRKGIDLEKIGW